MPGSRSRILAPMLQDQLDQLETRLNRLIAAYRQERLEKKRALQERDRLLALNAELKRRIEGVVERLRLMEGESAS
jgi:cell division protein ZapB